MEMPEIVREQLEALCQQTQADSLSEVIRRAIAVYDYLWSEKAKGSKTVVKDTNGSERELVLL